MKCWKCGAANDADSLYCGYCRHLTYPTPLQLGKYAVIDFIGGGQFGQVYLCHHPTIPDRQVAVKKLTVDASGTDTFEETRAGGRLDHPNIVRLLDWDADEQLLIMEYLPGGTLEERLVTD